MYCIVMDYYDSLWVRTAAGWTQLAAVCGAGKIDKVVSMKRIIQEGRREYIEAVKRITKVWEERNWF